MKFEVTTLSADNLLTRQWVEALDAAEARAQIAARGLAVARVVPARGAAAGGLGWQRGPRFSVVLFSQELLALLRAGLSLVEGLEALHEKEAQEGTRQVLGRLLTGLRQGLRFSSVLEQQAAVFSPLYVGLVRTAEGTSDLPRSLERFIAYDKQVAAVRNKIVSASIYPAILLAVGSIVSLFLLGYVVPRFAEVYRDSGRSLPWLSELMLGWGQFLSAHPFEMLAAAALLLGSAGAALRRVLKSRGIGGLVSLLPGVRAHVRVFELSRLYLALGMLVEGGIPLVTAMGTVQAIVSPRIQAALRASRAEIEAGLPLSQAFERHGLCTPISQRMLRVGERSGRLGALLLQSAAFYDEELGRWIDRFTRAFEPLLMAVIGLVVGVIVLTLYMPIFDLAGSI